jgi:alpha-methylacyl-CoA racemase
MGALSGYKIIELAGIGPAPMGGMILADMGAEVIRIERPGAIDPKAFEPISGRNKKSVVLDLKQDAGKAALISLVQQADALIDPYRPGVCEKLGFGPDECLARNPRLVFARMTGWGQTGPLAQAAGHDLNYIAITGALHAIGRRGERPTVPLNLVGDFGGGGMLLVTGILGGLLEAAKSGQGQVIDVAMVDGTAQLMWMMQGMQQVGTWNAEEREANLLDGAAHFYDTYECADGKYVAIGAIEPQFYRELLARAEISDPQFQAQHDTAQWPELKQKLGEVFKTKTRDEWDALMAGSDACFAPVLTMVEAASYGANTERSVYTDVEGLTHPAPAPRFSRTPSQIRHGTQALGADTVSVLENSGMEASAIQALLETGAAVGSESLAENDR